MFTFGENVARTKAMVEMTAPVMATGRQPNLFVRADTIGPGRKMYICQGVSINSVSAL